MGLKHGGGSIGGANVGGSSILVIFVLLCITTFATLAMVSATASLRLANQVVAAADEFFDANNRAEMLLSEVSEVVRHFEGPFRTLQLMNLGTYYYGGMIHYSVDINDSLRLDVKLEVVDGSLHVVSWLMVPIFDPDEYGGGEITLMPGL